MTVVVMILALLIPLVMVILLILLEPITDKGLLRRMIAIMATTAVLTGLLVILCTLLLAYGPLVRSSGAKNAVKQEGTTNADIGASQMLVQRIYSPGHVKISHMVAACPLRQLAMWDN